MEVSPHSWSAYARLQETLERRRRVDEYAWGLEAGLNRVLDGVCSAEDLERAVRSGARKHRHRASLLRLVCAVGEHETSANDPAAALDARAVLSHIQRSVAHADWVLLRALAEGYGYRHIARALDVSPGALRARTLRLRRALRPAVADILQALAS
jgi:DNA-directed RNA polymerase specialized sigma24 family protein